MRMYTVQFTDVAVTAQQDFFQIEALVVPATVHAVFLSQSSDVGDAESEGLSIQICRVTDAVTDDLATVQADVGDATQNANVAVNETTELVTGKTIYHSEVWSIGQNFIYLPTPEMRPVIQISNAMVVNLNTTPADSITVSGTIYFSESGS